MSNLLWFATQHRNVNFRLQTSVWNNRFCFIFLCLYFFLLYCYYYSVMPVSAYMALAFVFGFIQIKMMMNWSVIQSIHTPTLQQRRFPEYTYSYYNKIKKNSEHIEDIRTRSRQTTNKNLIRWHFRTPCHISIHLTSLNNMFNNNSHNTTESCGTTT